MNATKGSTSRRPVYIGNWKMNKNIDRTRSFLREFIAALNPVPDAEMALAIPFTSLAAASEEVSGSPVSLAAQTVHWESPGAWTGEIGCEMLVDLGVRYVLVGHSERRTHFGETDERVARKAKAVQDSGMIPVLCVGESQDERDSGRTEAVIESQIQRGLDGVRTGENDEILVAYEPVWAIGTGRTATVDQAAGAHRFLRQALGSLAGGGFAARTRILYGGSANVRNIASLAANAEIDGGLVGGASLDPIPWLELIRAGVRANLPGRAS